MQKLPISVFIIAKNEADRIPRAINAVKEWVDEVIVVDSGSTDDTVLVAEQLGAKVSFREWIGYGPQKVFAESLCRNDWLLNLDADEEVSAGLAEEIRRALGTGTSSHSAFRLPILPLYPFQKTGHRWTAFHKPVRLYERNSAGFKDHPVHDSVIVRCGSIGTFREPVLHRSFRSLSHHIEKVNSYSSAQSEDLFKSGRVPSGLMILVTPVAAFFKQLLLRREFVNGVDGIIVSYMYAFQRFIRLAKTRERFLNSRRE
jgi:glycosyltransferase involved in cell wall biosynthesis